MNSATISVREYLTSPAAVGLRPRARLLLFALAAYIGKSGACWPSLAELAQVTGKHSRRVQDDIAELRRVGAITQDLQHGQQTPIYRLGPAVTGTTETSSLPTTETSSHDGRDAARGAARHAARDDRNVVRKGEARREKRETPRGAPSLRDHGTNGMDPDWMDRFGRVAAKHPLGRQDVKAGRAAWADVWADHTADVTNDELERRVLAVLKDDPKLSNDPSKVKPFGGWLRDQDFSAEARQEAEVFVNRRMTPEEKEATRADLRRRGLMP